MSNLIKRFKEDLQLAGYAGIQHFFTRTLVRSWDIFNEIKWKRQQTLSTILSLQEVRKIIYALPTLQSHTFYLTLYSLGPRLREATTLQVKDILSERNLAVLHTWGSALQYHPHLHLVIPGGALSEKSDQWLPSRQDLFVHTKPLAVVFKAKFRDAMKKNRLFDAIDPSVWNRQWVVDSQAVGKGRHSLRYLSRYVFRVSISNNRIKSMENRIIKFQYKDRRKKSWKTMSLDAMEFIRRFLQHVLPKGFMKIRHYGFLHPNSSLSIEEIRELISFIHDVIMDLLPEIPGMKRRGIQCRCCGHDLKFITFLIPLSRWGPCG